MIDSKNFCVVEKCENPAARHVCKKHQVDIRLGRLEAEPGWGVRRNPNCSRGGCDWPADSRKDGALCHTHRRQPRGTGSVRPKLRRGEKSEVCIDGACLNPPASRNLCFRHYQYHISGRRLPEKTPCGHEGCAIMTRKGHCGKHMYQFEKYGLTWDNRAPDAVRLARHELKPVCLVPLCVTKANSIGVGLCPAHNGARGKLSVDVEHYLRLMAVKSCEMCGDKVPLATDHDHSCHPEDGKKMCEKCIRGRICLFCNSALGFLRDDPGRARMAITYLEAFQAKS